MTALHAGSVSARSDCTSASGLMPSQSPNAVRIPLAPSTCSRPRLQRLREREVAAPDIDHVRQRRLEEKVDLAVRRLQAQFAAAGFVQEPPTALLLDLIGQRQLDHRCASRQAHRAWHCARSPTAADPGRFRVSPARGATISGPIRQARARPRQARRRRRQMIGPARAARRLAPLDERPPFPAA